MKVRLFPTLQGTILHLASPEERKEFTAAGYRGRYRTVSLPTGTRAISNLLFLIDEILLCLRTLQPF